MNLKLIILIEIFSIFSLIITIQMIKKEKLDLKYALLWIFLTIVISILGFFPNFINIISKTMGIYEPVNSMFFIGFIFVLLILYSIIIQLSRISTRQKQLAQHMAIFEYDNRMKNNLKN